MKTFIGTKIVNALPMTRIAYNEFRGWKLPDNENGDDEGYLVEYTDGGKPNTDQYAGYVSWSPKEQFDNAYREMSGLTFGEALEGLKLGKKAARSGWNGKGMFVFLVDGSTFSVSRKPLLGIYPEGHIVDYRPHIDMKTADDQIVPWVASQTDVLAEDWCFVA
jgi:hypothetical protein